jgi:hypothetical protein
MSDQRRQPEPWSRRSYGVGDTVSMLPITADASRGSSNLATIPRAGNVSSDTRAGRPG